MVRAVLEDGWTIEAAAERWQVDAKTVRKWRDRWLAEGDAGLKDRSSRPRSCPWATPVPLRQRVIELRAQHRWGAAHIGHEVGLAASTTQKILAAAGQGRLDRGDRATAEPVRRYQRDRPGELVHVDVKKLAAIPSGGGWRLNGRGPGKHRGHSGAGYRFLHTAIDDRTRLVYSEILDDEQGLTSARFWQRAHAHFAALGITVERVLTDNGTNYRSRHFAQAVAASGAAHKRTRPYRPQTNGKVERFHRILLEEWAYLRAWTSETERAAGYAGFCHFYNHHRSHGSLGWSTPTATLTALAGDNVPGTHT
ncbi:MAG: IS481 family transposase [Acidobacteriota bacterium]|nr:IS481 family transposase [Acidobacteriota bacterium]